MGLYKYCFKIRLGADKTWDCSLWWLGKALQRLLQSQPCLAQVEDWFSSSKTEKARLGNSGPGYVLLQFTVLVMLTLSAWQCLLPVVGRYGLEPFLLLCPRLVFGCFYSLVCMSAQPCQYQELTAWAVGWELGEDGALLYKNGVDVSCFRSSCVASAWDYPQNLYLAGNKLWLSGASCTPAQVCLDSRLRLSCSSGNLSLRDAFFLSLLSSLLFDFQVCSLSI